MCGTLPKTRLPRQSSSPPSTWTNLTGGGNAMKKLLIPKSVFDQILSSVLATPDGLETGVTLFGSRIESLERCCPGTDRGHEAALSDSAYVVLAITGPGRRATHEPAHYSGDDGHAN